MSINNNIKIQLFKEFYSWLKDDGLKAKKSERLHKKTIFAALLNNHKMTQDNFVDFLEDREKKFVNNLKNKIIVLQGEELLISDIKIIDNEHFNIYTHKMVIKCRFSNLEDIKQKIKG